MKRVFVLLLLGATLASAQTTRFSVDRLRLGNIGSGTMFGDRYSYFSGDTLCVEIGGQRYKILWSGGQQDQALVYDTTAKLWKPGSVSGGPSSVSLNQLTSSTNYGVVSTDRYQQIFSTASLITTPSAPPYRFVGNATNSSTNFVQINTDPTSTLYPLAVYGSGTTDGVRVSPAGVLSYVGSGGINASQFRGSYPIARGDLLSPIAYEDESNTFTLNQTMPSVNGLELKRVASGKNISIGKDALKSLSTDMGNIAIGDSSLLSATGFQNSIVIGHNSYKTIATWGSGSKGAVVIGNNVLKNATASNFSIGPNYSDNLTTANDNIAVGYGNLFSLTTNVTPKLGHDNVAVGWNGYYLLQHGKDNVGMGEFFAPGWDSGSYNVHIGNFSGGNWGGGSQNVFLGYQQGGDGYDDKDLTNSTLIGYRADAGGTYTNHFGMTALGALTNVDHDSSTVLGIGATSTAKHQIMLGSTNDTAVSRNMRIINQATIGSLSGTVRATAGLLSATASDTVGLGTALAGKVNTSMFDVAGATAGAVLKMRASGVWVDSVDETGGGGGLTWADTASSPGIATNYDISLKAPLLDPQFTNGISLDGANLPLSASGQNLVVGTPGDGFGADLSIGDTVTFSTGSTPNVKSGYLKSSTLSDHRTWTLQNASGTIALLSDTVSLSNRINAKADSSKGWDVTDEANNNYGHGGDALSSVAGGYRNVGIGDSVLSGLTTGNSNVGIGYNVFRSSTTGGSAIGIGTLISPLAQPNNRPTVYIGKNIAPTKTVTGANSYNNIAIGGDIFTVSATKQLFDNIAIGWYQMEKADYASDNNVIGFANLQDMYTGDYNNVIGDWALANGDSMYSNNVMGQYAGTYLAKARDNVIIGDWKDAFNDYLSYSRASVLIGHDIEGVTMADDSLFSTIVIGDSAQYAAMRGGVAIGKKAVVGHDSSTALGTLASTTAKHQIMLGAAGDTTVSANLRITGQAKVAALSGTVRATAGVLSATASDTVGLAAALAGGGWKISNQTTNNYAHGGNALDAITSGAQNVVIGDSVLRGVSTGSGNVGVGYNIGGTSNPSTSSRPSIYVGRELGTNLAGTNSHNVALGYQSLDAASPTSSAVSANTSVGWYNLRTLIAGTDNNATGNEALKLLRKGNNNVATAFKALVNVDSGNGNVGIGYGSGSNLVTGSSNVFVGDQWGASYPVVANNSVIIGKDPYTTGDTSFNNVIIGPSAVGAKRGSVAIGYEASAGYDSSVAIGAGASAVAKHQVVLGSMDTTITWRMRVLDKFFSSGDAEVADTLKVLNDAQITDHLKVSGAISNANLGLPSLTAGGTENVRTITVDVAQHAFESMSGRFYMHWWVSTDSTSGSDSAKAPAAQDSIRVTTGTGEGIPTFGDVNHGMTNNSARLVVTIWNSNLGSSVPIYFYAEVMGRVYRLATSVYTGGA